jgi:integrase/recombinase XerD
MKLKMEIKDLIPDYLADLKIRNLSVLTIKRVRHDLNRLVNFLESEKITDLDELSADSLRLYQEELTYRLTDKGKPLSARTRASYLGTVRGFSEYLYKEDYLTADLGKSIVIPKQPQRLPKLILEPGEIKKIFAAADMQSNRGYRNRVILEMLYDTEVRAAEMAAIKTVDLDLTQGYLTVRYGKGAKDRVVPVSRRVCELLKTYLLMIRPELTRGKDPGYLVLNRWGDKMTPTAVWAIVKRCAQLSGIKKNVSTHTFRHSCATHMLKNGAPIRHIQELLGHESLESTQIYTKVTINDLKKIHAQYHPGESL